MQGVKTIEIRIDDIFGGLQVIKVDEEKHGYYLCKCLKCNNPNLKSVRKDHLVHGHITDCGCNNKEKRSNAVKKQRQKKNIQFIKDNILYVKCSNSDHYFMCDIQDKNIVDKHTWYENDSGYICTRIGDRIIKFHRYILRLIDKNNDHTYNVVDHIDGNVQNNCRINLKVCDQVDNMKNIKIRNNNTSGYVGVEYIERINRYHAYITSNKILHNLGYFKTLEEAIKARKEAEKEYGFNIRTNCS